MAEMTKLLIMQLCNAKNLIKQDKHISICREKPANPETLEKKKQEIAQLHAQIEHKSVKGEELKYQEEKSGNVAFEDFERAVNIAKRKRESGKDCSLKEKTKQKKRCSRMDPMFRHISKRNLIFP